MSSTAIQVENISKLYRLGEVSTGTISHDLNRWWHRLRGKQDPYAKVGEVNDRTQKTASNWIWALKDLNFEIKKGEVLGIIGRNGAGKSTFLKILSRVTAPTTGQVKVNGRIASLLEVGTGFHPDLTGRENIFLNGAILGMRKADIANKLDAIIDFSGCERFIDTPVKRYSSGMYVRLAFAVAAHLDPDILIVDEVLAVGDAEFQKKCLGKMQEVSHEEGRTVIFVSHNIGSVLQLCTSSILMANGSVSFIGSPQEAASRYLGQSSASDSHIFNATPSAKQRENSIVKASSVHSNGDSNGVFLHNEPITILIQYRITRWVMGTEVRLVVRDRSLRTVFTEDSVVAEPPTPQSQTLEAAVTIPACFLRPGAYCFTFVIFIPHVLTFDLVENVLDITVNDGGSKYAASEGMDYGCVFAPCEWNLKYSS